LQFLSLFMASNAVSSVNVAVVDSGEVSRSAVHNRYNNVPRTRRIDWRQFCTLGYSLYEEVSAMQIGF
jgi:hypothetical protein